MVSEQALREKIAEWRDRAKNISGCNREGVCASELEALLPLATAPPAPLEPLDAAIGLNATGANPTQPAPVEESK